MTDVKSTTNRELTIDDMETVVAAAQLYTNPGVVRGFNPQPDPPAMQSDVQPQFVR
jgi:hypothetical protein